jgi:hypothetical protein
VNMKSMVLTLFINVLDVIEDLVVIFIASGYLLYGWFVDKEIFQNAPVLWSGVAMILGLMTIANLRDRRRRFRKIHETVDETLQEIRGSKVVEFAGADHFFKGEQEEIRDRLINARTIDLLGITLSTTVGPSRELIKNRLGANGEVRIIILDSSSSDALTQLVKRSWSKKASIEKYTAMLENTSDLLEEISSEPGSTGSFEIGYLPFIPSVGMTLVDSRQENGVGIVSIYHQLKKSNLAFCIYKKRDPETFNFYCEQFDLMWDDCKTNKVKKII